MPVRIAIPVPTATDVEYNQRSLPPYLEALKATGAEPVVVPIIEPKERLAELLATADGILLPGSRYDVDPSSYGEPRQPECGEDDPVRTAADELLLEDAFARRKPLLAICHGAQTLNVWRGGTLIQDLKTQVNHSPGREVVNAHPVKIAEGSRLSSMLSASELAEVQVNSSHHQAIRKPGEALRVAAVSSVDGVIEAVELDSTEHFVVAVQWHPERTFAQSSFSRAIFAAFVQEAVSRNY
jgi:putative glutamine amidotransferase